MTVMLAQKLKKVRKIRQDISMIEYNFRNIPDRFIKILNEEIKPKLSEKQDIERLKVLNEKLGDAIADVKVFFKDFAREHERYMTLVPVEERQPE